MFTENVYLNSDITKCMLSYSAKCITEDALFLILLTVVFENIFSFEISVVLKNLANEGIEHSLD